MLRQRGKAALGCGKWRDFFIVAQTKRFFLQLAKPVKRELASYSWSPPALKRWDRASPKGIYKLARVSYLIIGEALQVAVVLWSPVAKGCDNVVSSSELPALSR